MRRSIGMAEGVIFFACNDVSCKIKSLRKTECDDL